MLRSKQNGQRFEESISKFKFLNENDNSLIKVSINFVPKGTVGSMSVLVYVLAWHWIGDMPLPETEMSYDPWCQWVS